MLIAFPCGTNIVLIQINAGDFGASHRQTMGDHPPAATDIEHRFAGRDPADKKVMVSHEAVFGVDSVSVTNSAPVNFGFQDVMQDKQFNQRLPVPIGARGT